MPKRTKCESKYVNMYLPLKTIEHLEYIVNEFIEDKTFYRNNTKAKAVAFLIDDFYWYWKQMKEKDGNNIVN